MTLEEKKLWEHIRDRKIDGIKFRRQYSLCGFVLDFYSPEIKMAIEIDGGYHFTDQQRDYDNARQRLIESLQIEFIRFKNEEIWENLLMVVEKIKAKAKELVSPLLRGRR